MTEQATAQDTNQQQNDGTKAAADAKAAEHAFENEAAARQRLRQQEEREAFEIRERIRQERAVAGLVDSKFAASAYATYMRSVIEGVDPNSVDFVTGMAGIASFEQDKKVPGYAKLTATDGTVFNHKVGQDGTQSFGLTEEQLKATPMSPAIAAHLADMCAAAGYTHVSLTGSIEQKETMWLAARQRGLLVDNFVPRQEIQDQYNAYKAAQLTSGMSGTARDQGAPGTDAPTAQAPKEPGTAVTPAVAAAGSRHVGENIVDAEWEPVKDAPPTRYLAQPVLRLTDQSSRGSDDNNSGPKALPPPSGPK